jgi:hypothetical protein
MVVDIPVQSAQGIVPLYVPSQSSALALLCISFTDGAAEVSAAPLFLFVGSWQPARSKKEKATGKIRCVRIRFILG